MRIHLNIGSNQGDRRGFIARAAALVASGLAPCRVLLSDYCESEPQGYDSPHPFLNRGLLVDTLGRRLDPEAVLDVTQAIERRLAPDSPHRNPDGSYRDRCVDIDIIDIDGGMIFSSPRLTLPHPKASERCFVIIPMRELDARANLTI
ncbi:MAG: 2-amino-4-hydroxy-6-hydroxymethyldihydropteridine diphosphokinase [Bacteroides sp.]|nr:2-amino-4-hydroxy-6-hydroxymethyldihydropteridine diphosphokinase [Bacteroides sp.]MCM1096061.1 2-amino-4-hydroxy-6-hydroxymethyldihydropteridine diphosphokinase [Terasakiella sp.]